MLTLQQTGQLATQKNCVAERLNYNASLKASHSDAIEILRRFNTGKRHSTMPIHRCHTLRRKIMQKQVSLCDAEKDDRYQRRSATPRKFSDVSTLECVAKLCLQRTSLLATHKFSKLWRH
jgi:hypothetical protein